MNKKHITALIFLIFKTLIGQQPQFVLLIDDSKSMVSNSLWDNVKKKSIDLVNSLPAKSQLDLFFYGDIVTSYPRFSLPDNFLNIKEKIEEKSADGNSTKTYSSIENILTNSTPDIFFLFTDGKANAEDKSIYNLQNTINRFESINSYLIIVRFGNEEILNPTEEKLCVDSKNCIYLKNDYNFAIIESKAKEFEFNKDVDTLEISFYTYGTDLNKLKELKNGVVIQRTKTPSSITGINRSIVTDLKTTNGYVLDPNVKNKLFIDFDNRRELDAAPTSTPHKIDINFEKTGRPDVFILPSKILATYSNIGHCGIDSMEFTKNQFKHRSLIQFKNVFEKFNFHGDCNSFWIEFKLSNVDTTQINLNFEYGEINYLSNNYASWRLNYSDIANIKLNNETCSLDVEFLDYSFSLSSLFQFSKPFEIHFEYENSSLTAGKATYLKSILANSNTDLKFKKTKSLFEWLIFILFLMLVIAIIAFFVFIAVKNFTKKKFQDGLITIQKDGNIVASIPTKNATRIYLGNQTLYIPVKPFDKICGEKDKCGFFNHLEGYYIYVNRIGFTYNLKTPDNQTIGIINFNQNYQFKNLTIKIS